MAKHNAIGKMKVKAVEVNLGHVRSGRSISRPKQFED